jgi:hypothetical protein
VECGTELVGNLFKDISFIHQFMDLNQLLNVVLLGLLLVVGELVLLVVDF